LSLIPSKSQDCFLFHILVCIPKPEKKKKKLKKKTLDKIIQIGRKKIHEKKKEKGVLFAL